MGIAQRLAHLKMTQRHMDDQIVLSRHGYHGNIHSPDDIFNIFPYVLYVPIWRCPKIEVPLSILHFCLGFSLINSPFSGGPQPFQPLYILYLAGWPLGKNSIGKVHPKLCPSGSRAEHRWEHLGTDGELVVKWPQVPRRESTAWQNRQGRWEIQSSIRRILWWDFTPKNQGDTRM